MIQSILYGIYFVLFTRTMAVLLSRKIMRTEMYRVMIVTAIVMWIIATAHLTVGGVRVVRIFAQERSPDGSSTTSPSFDRFSTVTGITSVGLNLIQVIVGDGFLLYRMAVVWGRDWRFYVFPLILLVAGMVSVAGVIHELNTASNGAYLVNTGWIISFIAMTLSTNIFCTSLIAVKIWKINSLSSQFVAHSLTPVMLVVVESGAIYSCCLIALLVCYLTGSWGQYLILDSIASIVGCVFSMVIVRLGLGLSRPDGTTLHLHDPAVSSMAWQSPRRRSSEISKLTLEDTTAVRDDPKSESAVGSPSGRSLFPAAVELSGAGSLPQWRN